MFNPAKAISAGALVLVVGGALVITQPFDRHGGNVLGAASDAEINAPVPVTGTGPAVFSACSIEDLEDTAELYRSIFTCDVTWSMSDPRLEGEVTRISEAVDLGFDDLAAVREDDGGWPRVSVSGYSIRNDGGSWRERPRPAIWTAGTDKSGWPLEAVTTMVFDGEEGYEGLVAVLQREVSGSESQTFTGVIMDTRLMPPVPENIATE